MQTLLQGANGGMPATPFVWSSSNPRVATIHPSSGVVQAEGEGESVLTATAAGDPRVRLTIVLNVVAARTVVLIRVDPDKPILEIGEGQDLIAQVQLADGQVNGNVVWSSSDDTIATVNPTNGRVSALREGRVTIVASYALDPRYKGLADVQVVKDRRVLPSPSPSAIVFGPGATPLPTTAPPTMPTTVATPGQGPVSDTLVAARITAGLTTIGDFSFVDARNGWAVGGKNGFSGWVSNADNGVVRHTSNGGASWVSQKAGDGPLGAVSFVSPTEGWVGGNTGLFHTVDGGTTWTEQTIPTPGGVWALHFSDSRNGTMVCLGGRNWSIFITEDGGQTWGLSVDHAELGNGPRVWGSPLGSLLIDGPFRFAGGGLSRLAVALDHPSHAPDDPKRMLAISGGGNLANSTDGGASWAVFDAVVSGPRLASWEAVGLYSSRDALGVFGRSIYRSNDGGANWLQVGDSTIPDSPGRNGFFTKFAVVDASHAWGIYPDGNGLLRISPP